MKIDIRESPGVTGTFTLTLETAAEIQVKRAVMCSHMIQKLTMVHNGKLAIALTPDEYGFLMDVLTSGLKTLAGTNG